MDLTPVQTMRIAALLTRLERTRFSRRGVLAGAAASAAALAIGGRRAGAQSGKVTELTILGYGGLYGDNQKKAVVDPYVKESGIKVNVVTGQSAVPALVADAEKDDPTYDVVSLTNIEYHTVKKQGNLLAAYDEAKLPNLKDLYPIAVDLPYAVNVELDAWGLLYNTDEIKTAPDSWAALWDPAYKDKVAFEIPVAGDDSLLDLLAAAVVGGGTSTDVDTAGFSQAKKLKGQAKFTDSATGLTSFQNGEVVLMPEYNNEAFFMQTDGFPSSFAFPKQGAFPVAVWLGIPKNLNDERKAAAEQFVNYYLSPAPQQEMAKVLYAGPTNKTVKLSEDLVGKVLYGDLVDQAFKVDWDYVVSNQDNWIDRWNREVATS
jgi:putative spermidine/putrescine transport system substrate-binding protein